ncbi:MAG: type II toxin-antitoxin system HicA family toxin [Gammaproteobacteria bacterium]|nr:type II toxin-antitoxin system HicA family toxin [Gammaproteobacteria bacterium]
MRTKHRRTLESVFKKPTPTGIRWADIVALLKAVDVDVSQRSGSRVLLKRGEMRMVVHRPHPETETGKATVRDIAAFLKTMGVQP